jgi:hypothetical protein
MLSGSLTGEEAVAAARYAVSWSGPEWVLSFSMISMSVMPSI